MKRREFIKLSAVAGGSLLASNWLLETEVASAASNEIASKNGILQLTLVADAKLIKYGNSSRWAMTYNGVFPAPTLRANPGDTLKIKLVNKLNQATNLHTHGLHVSPAKNSDNPLVMVAPGESFDYEIKIPLTQKKWNILVSPTPPRAISWTGCFRTCWSPCRWRCPRPETSNQKLNRTHHRSCGPKNRKDISSSSNIRHGLNARAKWS